MPISEVHMYSVRCCWPLVSYCDCR